MALASQNASLKIGVNLWNLKRHSLWPVSKASETMTLGTLLRKLREFKCEKLAYHAEGHCPSCEADFGKSVRGLSGQAQLWFSGLCLDCVKYGNIGESKKVACRIKHEEDFLGVLYRGSIGDLRSVNVLLSI